MCITSILAEESIERLRRIEGAIEMESSIPFPIPIPWLAIPILELELKSSPILELTPALLNMIHMIASVPVKQP